MHILILGGTSFLGRHLVEGALARGHAVTLFHRGRTNPELFPEVEKILGDRGGDHEALAGRSFDAVIDTSGYLPRNVEAAVQRLADTAGLYAFVSTFNVYDGDGGPVFGEDSPLRDSEPFRDATEVTDESYGALKLLCERAVEAGFAGRSLIVRPGVLVGPYDYSHRFAYWLERVADGGRVLAPGRPERPVQCLDAGDLAAFLLDGLEAGTTGVFNTAGPAAPLPMADLLAACRTAVPSDAELVWVDEGFLLEQGVIPWRELPFWLPEETPIQIDAGKALAAGLACRPLAETAAVTWEWLLALRNAWPAEARWSAGNAVSVGLSREREAELLAEWERVTAGVRE